MLHGIPAQIEVWGVTGSTLLVQPIHRILSEGHKHHLGEACPSIARVNSFHTRGYSFAASSKFIFTYRKCSHYPVKKTGPWKTVCVTYELTNLWAISYQDSTVSTFSSPGNVRPSFGLDSIIVSKSHDERRRNIAQRREAMTSCQHYLFLFAITTSVEVNLFFQACVSVYSGIGTSTILSLPCLEILRPKQTLVLPWFPLRG